MAKRGRPARATSLDGLVAQLSALDQQRKKVVDQIRQATNRLLSGENPFPWRKQGRPGADGEAGGRKRKRRKMSKEAREKIAAAQRARWARQKRAS